MKTKFSGFFAMAVLVAAMASTASATELCSGVTNVTTIGAGGCDVAGDPGVIFGNFTVSVAGAESADVGISGTSFVDNQIDLSFEISVTDEANAGSADIILSYTVTGGIIGVDDQFQASPLSPGGSVTISEIACSVPFSTACPQPATNTLANYAGVSTGQLVEDSETFAGGVAVNPVYIKKDIDLSDAVMSEFTNSQQVSSVPETATFSLMGAGLLGLGVLKRRFRKK
jgi:hypothetical protein